MEDKLIEGLAYALPALVTGGVAYFVFTEFLKQNYNEKKMEILSQKKKDSLPIKLQAYERLVLFCERIHPAKLLVRVKPIGDKKEDYLQLLVANIEQEFDHNLVQQLYVSEQNWKVIVTAKNSLINSFKENIETSENAQSFREAILQHFSKKESPTDTAVAFLKNDIKKLL